MSSSHVELFQYIFCSIDLCDYGSSPRSCWPTNADEFQKFIDNWKGHLRVEQGPDFDWENAKVLRWGHEHTDYVRPYYHYTRQVAAPVQSHPKAQSGLLSSRGEAPLSPHTTEIKKQNWGTDNENR
jgi:hypothetical protein